MADRNIEISPQYSGLISKADLACQRVKDETIEEMTGVLGTDPKVTVDVPSAEIEQKKLPPEEVLKLAIKYVSNMLKGLILKDLAGTGSTALPYRLSKDEVANKTGRIKGWAAGFFKPDIVNKLNPEQIFESVWDEVIDELSQGEDDTKQAA